MKVLPPPLPLQPLPVSSILRAHGWPPRANPLPVPTGTQRPLGEIAPHPHPLHSASAVNFSLQNEVWALDVLLGTWLWGLSPLSCIMHLSLVCASKTWSSLLIRKPNFHSPCFPFMLKSPLLLSFTVQLLKRGAAAQCPALSSPPEADVEEEPCSAHTWKAGGHSKTHQINNHRRRKNGSEPIDVTSTVTRTCPGR